MAGQDNNMGHGVDFDKLALISTKPFGDFAHVAQSAAHLLGYGFKALIHSVKTPLNSTDIAVINLFQIDIETLLDNSLQNDVIELLRRSPHSINFCVIDQKQIDSETMFELGDFFTEFHEILFIPCNQNEILARIRRFVKRKNASLDESNRSLLAHFSSLNLIGNSEVFLQTLKRIKKVADFDVPVLVEGETGTGKENSARAIHYLSARKTNAFVPVNCAALPDDLLENELFGHEKGAFTDAKAAQEGLISIASGGTLFLDEIDSLTPKAQGALLRFLQTYEYRPLGSVKTQYADVRIICASNSCLRDAVQNHRFREDLLFRINVLHIHMPPLRDRSEDILIIAEALLKRFSATQNIPLKRLSPAAINFYLHYNWPGNVRELENTLLRQCLLSEGAFISPDYNENRHNDVADRLDAESPCEHQSFQHAKAQAIEEFEQRFVKQLLSVTQGNISEAARISGKERRALGKLVKKYKIEKNQSPQISA